MKICVYAISKNEEKFVDRWVNSMKEADEIYVLDTGSSDNTVEKLKQLNVKVTEKKITPWRFDVARNISLDLLPNDTDICVCCDLDEVFEEGWRKKLEKIWKNNTTRLKYNYNWSLDENNKPLVNFYIEKIHCRNGYKWVNPVHEVLQYNGQENVITSNEITVNHYPDREKSRSNYLPLLELAVNEDPNNDRNVHYLGREYMYYKKWDKCIDTLIKHLSLKSATWKDERSASMRFISRSYINLKRYDEAKFWLDKAIEETPYLRDPYVERAMLEYKLKNYNEMIYYCNKALEIKEHTKSYINEIFSWNYTIYDLLSIAHFFIGNYDLSYGYICIACIMNPDDKRLKENKTLIENTLKEFNKKRI